MVFAGIKKRASHLEIGTAFHLRARCAVLNYGNNMRGGLKREPRFENDLPSIHANAAYVQNSWSQISERIESLQNSILGTSTQGIIVTVAS